MSHQEKEKTYTQEDMDLVLRAVRKNNKEAELSNQLLWAVVDAMGGHIEVPLSVWDAPIHTKQIIIWEDTTTLKLHLSVSDKKIIQGDEDDGYEEVQRFVGSDRVQRHDPGKRNS